MQDTPQTYTVQVAGLTRDLPLIEVAPGVRIAFVDCLGDAELTHAAARALAPKLAPLGPRVIVTPEAKSIPLAYALAIELGCEYVTLRKQQKPYMKQVYSADTRSITSDQSQTLYLDARYHDLVANQPVALVDDVVSTGSTLEGMEKLLAQLNVDIVARAAIFTEGDEEDWDDIIALGHLPVFLDESE